MAHLKTLWEGEVGREISRLWTPQIFPILLPSHDHLSISRHLYLLRLPRSPLMQGWEGSEEARSAVQGRVVGEECHMIQLWNSTSCPACLVAFSTNLNGSPHSSKLPPPSPPGSSLRFFFTTAPEQVSPKSPRKEKRPPVFRGSPGRCTASLLAHPCPPRMRLRWPRQENWVRAIPTHVDTHADPTSSTGARLTVSPKTQG